MFGIGNISMAPQTPQLPQMPFGLSTLTDFIGLTEPTPIIALPVPRHPSRIHQQQSSFETVHPQQLPTNAGIYSQQHYQENFYRPVLVQAPAPVPVANTVYPKPTYSSPNPQYPYSSATPLPPSNTVTSAFPNTSTVTSFGTPIPPPQQSPHQQYFSTSSFTPISKPIPSTSSASLAPPPPTIVIPQTTAPGNGSTEMLYDPVRRSASPTSSGVQIDLINLRQKLSRDVQNNMKIVTEQQSKIKDLKSRADEMETGYSHLKCDLEDLKRKKMEQDGKLKEIDSLLKSALTMSSFSSATALQVEMVEDEDGMNAMLVVAVAE